MSRSAARTRAPARLDLTNEEPNRLEEDVRRQHRAVVDSSNDESDLEQRVQQRTADLQRAVNELEAYSYSVAHDLRTPLRAIAGFANTLTEDFATRLPDEAQRFLEIIRASAERMGARIDALLALGRLSHESLQLTDVDTGDLVRECLETLQPEYEGRRVEITVGDLPAVRAHRVLLRDVWLNLLSNAFKYTRRREVARIEIGAEERSDAWVYYVRDNGVGFDMVNADRLFKVFKRLHKQDEYEGDGVGLATAKRIVDRHDDRIWADAAVDRGATFYFTLPANGRGSTVCSSKMISTTSSWR